MEKDFDGLYCPEENFQKDSFQDCLASATEMTGLIPAAPEDEEALKNYETLYSYLPEASDPD